MTTAQCLLFGTPKHSKDRNKAATAPTLRQINLSNRKPSMPCTYQKALARISDDSSKKNVLGWLADWKSRSDGIHDQMAANIENECSFHTDSFAELLTRAAASWSSDERLFDKGKFDLICRGFKMCGPRLRSPKPKWLGRAETIENFVRRRKDADPGIPEEDIVGDLGLSSGSSAGQAAQAAASFLLRVEVEPHAVASPRGILFATFPVDRVSHPFDGDMRKREVLVNSIGLGYILGSQWLVAVIYEPALSMILRLPTVGDAGDYPYFRPAARIAKRRPQHGSTFTLRPSEPGDAQPEVVHEACGWLFRRTV
jgi:hypothetical protein